MDDRLSADWACVVVVGPIHKASYMIDMVRVAFEWYDLVAALEFIKADGALIAHILDVSANFLCFKLLLLAHFVVGCVEGKERFLHASGIHSKFN